MTQQFSKIKISKKQYWILAILFFLMLGMWFLGKTSGYLDPGLNWLKIHLPIWLAVLVMIAVSVFALTLPLTARLTSPTGWLILGCGIIALLVLEPCYDILPGSIKNPLAMLAYLCALCGMIIGVFNSKPNKSSEATDVPAGKTDAKKRQKNV